ncbi:uncharacterized protein ARMOST_12370 [Armillaria ostoyae]|uniref:Uncharacterized protein n=1 Tax=Armillaria ostoyae TaxID=47428 RepID=A0A284RJR7_ARMOS|nr:uncharacterized protein ARMOST_12370 [Armillaria ostoyae]
MGREMCTYIRSHYLGEELEIADHTECTSKYGPALGWCVHSGWTEVWGRRVLGELATGREAVIIVVVALGESVGEQLCRRPGLWRFYPVTSSLYRAHAGDGNGITTSRISHIAKGLRNTLANFSLADDIVLWPYPVENPSSSVFHESKHRNKQIPETGGMSVLWNSRPPSFRFRHACPGWKRPCTILLLPSLGWTMEGRRIAVYESGKSSGDVDGLRGDYATTERFGRVTMDEMIDVDDSRPTPSHQALIYPRKNYRL